MPVTNVWPSTSGMKNIPSHSLSDLHGFRRWGNKLHMKEFQICLLLQFSQPIFDMLKRLFLLVPQHAFFSVINYCARHENIFLFAIRCCSWEFKHSLIANNQSITDFLAQHYYHQNNLGRRSLLRHFFRA